VPGAVEARDEMRSEESAAAGDENAGYRSTPRLYALYVTVKKSCR